MVLNFAQTMYLLPWAVLAVPLAVAAYPTLVAAHASGDEEAFRRTLAPTTRGVLLFSCLGAAALIATADPVARFFFPGESGSAAAAIAGFGPGLLGYGLFAVLSRALYARGDTRAAATTTAAGWLVVPVVAVLLARLLPAGDRLVAVTVANSVGMLVLGALLIVVVARRAGPVDDRGAHPVGSGRSHRRCRRHARRQRGRPLAARILRPAPRRTWTRCCRACCPESLWGWCSSPWPIHWTGTTYGR